jgi:hypothetical protein
MRVPRPQGLPVRCERERAAQIFTTENQRAQKKADTMPTYEFEAIKNPVVFLARLGSRHD